MNLTTHYMGLKLKSPLVVSASPISETVENIKRAEDAGAAAVVMYSLFEEQIRQQRESMFHYLEHGTHSYAESLTFFPEPLEFRAGPEEYLDLIRKAKESVDIPIIASLNATTIGSWTLFAHQMEQAGADALELNIYSIPTDMDVSGAEIEKSYIEIVSAIRTRIKIPLAVKLSPFFSNMANMAKRLDLAGASGLVLFNRFYQPDLDLSTFDVAPNLLLSTPQSQRLPMRWIAILYGRIRASLAATSGIHSAQDVVKMTMVGASVTMMASALLRHGIGYLKTVEKDLIEWMLLHEYESLAQMRGSASQMNVENPAAFERAQYMKALSSYPSIK